MNTEVHPRKPESFIKRQFKLAFSTATIASVGTFVVTFWVNFAIVSLVVILLMIGAIFADASMESETNRTYTIVYGKANTDHKLLSIPINGPIEGSSDGAGVPSLFGDSGTVYGYDIKEEIEDAADSGEYSGLVLEVNSPGGTIYGSKAIADGVAYFKKHAKKPVYASVQGLSASGSYWVSASADKIIADSGTGIGSIGVIYGPFSYFDKVLGIDGGLLGGGVITQNGIEESYFTAGEGKDAGNPFRRLTEREKTIMQQNVNDSYEQFVNYVAAQRKLSPGAIKNDIGAHLYSEQQALTKGLIDSIDSREEAYYQLAEATGIQGDNFRVVSSHTPADDFLTALGAKVFGPDKKAASSAKPLVCTGSVSVPLAFQGSPSAGCK